jgi:serine/threonine protein kinase
MDPVLSKISEHGEWEIPRQEIEIRHKIGDGSFGVVHEAVWRKTPIAVKVLAVHKNVDITEFRTEFEALTKLHHPNIMQLFGVCSLEKPYNIIIELMVSNIATCNSRNISKHRAINISIDIMRGLAYMHNRTPKCLIHRDLKPTNILLTQSGRVKIADFGISCFQTDSKEIYKMTGETGTYRYMAPEVLKSERYGTPVDIYSFGMILYGLVERTPFTGRTTSDIILSVIKSNKRPEFFNLKNTSFFDMNLRLLISDCWFVNANARPNALELVDRLQDLLLTVEDKTTTRCCGIQ